MKGMSTWFLVSRGLRGAAMAGTAVLSLFSATTFGAGLAGDTVQGSLILPWAPDSGNHFSVDAGGYPTTSLPLTATVGPGVEFALEPVPTTTFSWGVTADISDTQIRINESYSDPNPGSVWLVELTSWTLTLSDLDWEGGVGIAAPTIISQDPLIHLAGFDAHSVQFQIDEVSLRVSGPYSYSRTTIIQLAPIPEPSVAALILCGAIAGCPVARRRARSGA
jgi:hypothetical protein